MQLKHLNLTTSDVAELAAFFERFFEFRRRLERGSGAFTPMSNDENFYPDLDEGEEARSGSLSGNFPCRLLS
jgi:hypothetical protein